MGNKNTTNKFEPEINVRERHNHAIYINIPLNKQQLEVFTLLPCECEEYNEVCWLSIVIDDLCILEAYFNGTFINLSNFMKGWMCKLNLLVKCEVPIENFNNKQVVSGYQIFTLDFEKGLGCNLKKYGALTTQIVPTEVSTFRISSGNSGSTENYPLITGETYSAEMYNTSTNNNNNPLLVKLVGRLNSNLSSEQLNFAKFVINRPHKFLYQNYGKDDAKLAYSPEIGEGANFEWDHCVWIDIQQLELPILNRLNERLNETLNLSEIRCFIQPSYTLVDHNNTILATHK